MLMLFTALSLTVVAAVTNFWFWAETRDLATVDEKKAGNYNFGFWFKCYDDVPLSIPSEDLSGQCEKIYKNLIKRSDETVSSDEELVLHLSRSYIGLSIAACAGMLATLLTLLCGTWPGDCTKMTRHGLYCGAALVGLFTVLASMGSGICFLAAREVESDKFDQYQTLDTGYGWSFYLHWSATGLCVLADFLLVGLAKCAPEDVKSAQNYYYYNM